MNQLLKETTKILRQHTCVAADANKEAIEILSFASGIERTKLMTDDIKLTARQKTKLQNLIARRLQHEPLAYLFGAEIFLGRKFFVSTKTLIPRPATEIIAEQLIHDWRDQQTIIIDVGTGSGCAAISFALQLPQAMVLATDISRDALTVARRNAKKLSASPKHLHFLRTNLLPSSLLKKTTVPMVIFANLPYIPTAEIKKLTPDIRDFEPHSALNGGKDGLELYRELFTRLASANISNFDLYLELLPKQIVTTENLAKEHWPAIRAKKICADSANRFPVGIHLTLSS